MIDSGLDPATVRDEILANSSSLAGSGASPLVRRAAGVFGVLMVVGGCSARRNSCRQV